MASPEEWEAVLQEEFMSQQPKRKTHQRGIRFSPELWGEVEAYRERLERMTGARVSGGEAVRALLRRGLDAEARDQ